MRAKKVIIIGADHFNTLWLVRALGMAGFESIAVIVGVHKGKSFVAKSKYCKQVLIIKSLGDIVSTLMNLSFSQKTVVIASGDPVAKVLDTNYTQLSEKYILHNCCNKQGGILHWMDKVNMLSRAKECGLKIPYTMSLDLTLNNDLSDVPYPCLIKPEVSAESTKNTFRICHSEDELKVSIGEIKGYCKRVILQEYIKPDFECLLYGVSTKEEICIPGVLHKLHSCSHTNNLGMTSFAYLSSEIPIQVGNTKAIETFIRSIDYHGIFSVEFMITKDKAYFLEINMRNDGTSYITTQAGVNIPAIWSAIAYGINSNKFSRVFKREITYGMNEINYIKYTLKRVGIIQTFKDIFKAKAFSLWNSKDIKPFFYKFIYH